MKNIEPFTVGHFWHTHTFENPRRALEEFLGPDRDSSLVRLIPTKKMVVNAGRIDVAFIDQCWDKNSKTYKKLLAHHEIGVLEFGEWLTLLLGVPTPIGSASNSHDFLSYVLLPKQTEPTPVLYSRSNFFVHTAQGVPNLRPARLKDTNLNSFMVWSKAESV